MIPRFKVRNIKEAIYSVVSPCNGWGVLDRFSKETPRFIEAISKHLPSPDCTVLDYGCGMGRLAKALLKKNPGIKVIGVDASDSELKFAKEYVDDERIELMKPEQLNKKVDLAYNVYVLQHIPAIEVRGAIERIHHFLKPDCKFIYCNSVKRLALNENWRFVDDHGLGVDLNYEMARLFDECEDLFDLDAEPQIIKDIITGDKARIITSEDGWDRVGTFISHKAKVYKRKRIEETIQYFNVI